MKRLVVILLIAVGIAAGVAAVLTRPVRVPNAGGTWEPAEHEPVTH